jgi:hypothetical protein
MIGLKSYLPKLSHQVGLSQEMLYERQRALVKSGALYAEPGRGPGSGVRADASSLSIFLISLLAHDFLVDAPMTTAIGSMKSTTEQCPLTGKRTFKDALEAILNDGKLAQKVALVIVNRSAQSGTIDLGKLRGTSRRILRSEFKGPLRTGAPPPSGMDSIKTLRPNLIQQVAEDIATFSEVAK